MGLIYSKLWRKLTKEEELKKIVEKMRTIEDNKRSTQLRQKRIIANLILYSCFFYIMACIVIGIWFLPDSLIVRACLLIPLILVPFIIYGLKNLLSWYYDSKMSKANETYETLGMQKQAVINSIKENETFNRAKNILAQYAPDQLEKKDVPSEMELRKRLNTKNETPETQLRPGVIKPQPDTRGRQNLNQSERVKKSMSETTLATYVREAQLPLPQPVFPKDRSFGDKLVEYIVGDGPSYRFALICKHCREHNGMALKEEFSYMSFICCYCRRFNPSHIARPTAPRLPAPVPLNPVMKPSLPTHSQNQVLSLGESSKPSKTNIIKEEEEDNASASTEGSVQPFTTSSAESLAAEKEKMWQKVADELKATADPGYPSPPPPEDNAPPSLPGSSTDSEEDPDVISSRSELIKQADFSVLN